MYLDRPHLRFEGLYVSRNTYIKRGIVEWRVKVRRSSGMSASVSTCVPWVLVQFLLCFPWTLLCVVRMILSAER